MALKLVRDLANHATEGWHQLRRLSRRSPCTPIPTTVTFPWGTQQFWGNWQQYNWHLGQLGPQPLECAFLAMSYWAFREIENGRPVDEVIRLVVEGNDSIAAAGLGLLLAIETFHISEVSLALVSCQRLWHYDVNRMQQERMRNADLLGLGIPFQLTGEKAKAKEYLDRRVSRTRDVTQLAMRFAVFADSALRKNFQQALERFPSDLPYEFEEARSDQNTAAALTELAMEYAAFAVFENYQGYQTEDAKTLVAYQPPLSPEAVERGEKAGTYLEQYGYLFWAIKSLRDFKLATDKALPEAVTLARSLFSPSLFRERIDTKDHTPQSLVAAVAACVVCYGDQNSRDYTWALDVLARIDEMREPPGSFSGSKIPWHPAIMLVYALTHMRRVTQDDLDPIYRLLRLTRHPHQETSEFAFAALLADPVLQVSWTAAQLALDLAHYYLGITLAGDRDSQATIKASEEAHDRATLELTAKTPKPFLPISPIWISQEDNEAYFTRHLSDPQFDPPRGSERLCNFPIEKWCGSATFKTHAFELLIMLVKWTAARLNPPVSKHHSRTAELLQWNDALGDLLARAAPFFDAAMVAKEFLSPFLQGEDALSVIAEFADKTVKRHVLDATEVPPGTLTILDFCADRAVSDPTFHPSDYRAGGVSDRALWKLIDALLIVAVERANGAARFVNGNWSDIGAIMPTVTRLVCSIGWSADVMSRFLLLCERAGPAYPLDDFIEQASAALDKIDNAKGSWVGRDLTARIAGTVELLADVNFPLRAAQAQGLLRILDALVDLGDRRSAALEQTEVFKSIQVPVADGHAV